MLDLMSVFLNMDAVQNLGACKCHVRLSELYRTGARLFCACTYCNCLYFIQSLYPSRRLTTHSIIHLFFTSLIMAMTSMEEDLSLLMVTTQIGL